MNKQTQISVRYFLAALPAVLWLREMVLRYGMAEKPGAVCYEGERSAFLDGQITRAQ